MLTCVRTIYIVTYARSCCPFALPPERTSKFEDSDLSKPNYKRVKGRDSIRWTIASIGKRDSLSGQNVLCKLIDYVEYNNRLLHRHHTSLLLRLHLPQIECQFLAFKDIPISTTTLTRSAGNNSIQTTIGKLTFNGRFNFTHSLT